jgi:hypothetical protein
MRKTDKRRWRALTQQLNDFKIEAGWFANNRYDDGIGVAEIARIQNNGAQINVTPKMRGWFAFQGMNLKKDTQSIIIPPRPFMDNAARRVHGQEGRNAIIGTFMMVFNGNLAFEQALSQLKEWLQGVVTEEFIAINSPKLSEFTRRQRKKIDEKGTKPLQATGQMLASIQSKVTKK